MSGIPHAVEGYVSRGFEGVREAFAENFARRRELGGACCVYHRGEKVVDLWGGVRNKETGEPWEQDTMVIVYSATKGLAAMTLALAHSRGWLDYEERVVRVLAGVRAAGQGARSRCASCWRTRRACSRSTSRSIADVVADLDRLAAVLGPAEARVGAGDAAGLSRAHAGVLRRRAAAPGRPAASQPGTVLPGRDRDAARARTSTSGCPRRSRTRAWRRSRRRAGSRCCSASRFA